ncbi:rhomboid family intramembrane serine protease [Salinibaculum rarum]|jgi:membrane associated rhomboid family serine protease|uniref:rhomboid family intramembrane serine protease n=1 Tax=Salinibaculum rarum TaxID=3058903 RepID=UPI00265E8758|nr:rhomboid family intramembrane serine protease [Salinibaculum sp. KK48]
MRLRGRPTLQTLAVVLVVFLLQHVVGLLWTVEYLLFVLDATVAARPWALVTSVYAHSGLTHLAANLVALVIVGPLVARRTTALRYHAFFVGTGALSGLAEVFLGGLVGPSHAVWGASGAVLALLGYLLGGNVVSTRVLDRVQLSARAQLVLFAVVVTTVTVLASGPNTAVIGHATGLACGLVAGRLGVLDVSSPDVRYRP